MSEPTKEQLRRAAEWCGWEIAIAPDDTPQAVIDVLNTRQGGPCGKIGCNNGQMLYLPGGYRPCPYCAEMGMKPKRYVAATWLLTPEGREAMEMAIIGQWMQIKEGITIEGAGVSVRRVGDHWTAAEADTPAAALVLAICQLAEKEKR